MSSGPGKNMSSGPGARTGAVKAGPGPGPRLTGPGVNLQKTQDGQLVKTTPDGRTTVFNGPPCARCGEVVIGRVVSAMDKTFHPECFICLACNKPFPDGMFTEHENEAYCDPV
jgi:hypothetical protein